MMLLTHPILALAATLCASLVSADPHISPFLRHETRHTLPAGWNLQRRAVPETRLPLRIGLVQPNIAEIESHLLDVSHPNSPNYGKHWSASKVANTFRPPKEAIDEVMEWLASNSIAGLSTKLSRSGGWIEADVNVEEAERLLNTEYYIYEHAESGTKHIGCGNSYHLPEHIAKHVELITPTVHFDVKLIKREHTAAVDTPPKQVGQPGFGTSFPKTSGSLLTSASIELDTCDERITPICLRALYNFSYVPLAVSKNSIGIVEYTPQAYVPSDLDLFFNNFSINLLGGRPKLVAIDGATVQTSETGFNFNGESNLDLQYAMSLVGEEQEVTLYQVGDDVMGASFNNLLDALDGSFCTFEGGDDPNEDGIYPDPLVGGYQGSQDCGSVSPAYVISTSYSYNEADLTPAYTARQCAEYAKLGLMGITMLYSSGDYGVAGNDNTCLNSAGAQVVGGNIFSPSFPGTCPYITSVGATQVNPGANVTERESACEQVIYSGGGFSNYFAMPSYQKTAVESYLSTYPPPYATDIYNATGSRAYPDLSANGANYVVAIQGEYNLVYGTSASSPVVAALLSGINDARLAAGKGPIGFINPTIYSSTFSDAFNDIINGTNQGCGTSGFSAEPGWDPVTGLGTPNFPKLSARWLALP